MKKLSQTGLPLLLILFALLVILPSAALAAGGEEVPVPAADAAPTDEGVEAGLPALVDAAGVSEGATVETVVKDGVTTFVVTVPEGLEGKVKISVPAPEGNVVFVTEADGSEKPLEYSMVEDGTAYLLVDRSVEIRLEYRAGLFKDMAGHPAEAVSDFTGARDLFKGTSEHIFSPNVNIDRASMATLFHRLEHSPEAGIPTYVDTDRSAWYADAVAWVTWNNVSVGMGDGTYEPSRPVSRQELCTMLYRYSNTFGYELTADQPVAFADADAIPAWSKEAMEWAASTGLLQGKEGNLADPLGLCTRAEAAIILERFITQVVGQ